MLRGTRPDQAATRLRTQSSYTVRAGQPPDPMTQRKGEDRQCSPHNDSTAALAGSRPTQSSAQPAACSILSAIIHLQSSHQPSAAQPAATWGPASSHLQPSEQPSAAQPSVICSHQPAFPHLSASLSSHQPSLAQPSV